MPNFRKPEEEQNNMRQFPQQQPDQGQMQTPEQQPMQQQSPTPPPPTDMERKPISMNIRFNTDASGSSQIQQNNVVSQERIHEAMLTLQRYKAGKAMLESRIVESEQWWKQRHWDWMRQQGNPHDTTYTSGWLFNTIISKHADAIQAFPEPNILPREEGDKETAKQLSAIVPCILEQVEFEETYSDVMWQKLRQGTGCYGVFWDGSKLNGLGDISIRKIDLLNLFWEPGVTDIQQSQNVFHVEMIDNAVLEQMYPEVRDKLKGIEFQTSRYIYDDAVPLTDKSAVVDWYYHSFENGKKTLHFCKFVNDIVLFASENEQDMAETGWYAHGLYPFVFDRLFPVEGSPAGFGYIDVCKSAQEQIDLMTQAITKNALMASTPRYFMREDGGINEAEFADWTKPIVHTNGNLGSESILQIGFNDISGNYISILNNKITELKEVTGNTDSSNGIGSTNQAASAIAALQEASGKTSKASTMSAYRAYSRVINMVIELVRQFYDAPRQFRIIGSNGQPEYTSFDNSGMQMQMMGNDFGMGDLYRLPTFDIKVNAQSRNTYSKNAQNELAISLYNLGVLNPQQTDQSLLLLDTMDFDGKEELQGKIAQFGTLNQKFAQVAQIALMLAQQYDPAAADMLAQIIMGNASQAGLPQSPAEGQAKAPDMAEDEHPGEVTQVKNARKRAQGTTQV